MKCAKDSGKNWRKRYFVLTNNTLNYYTNDKDLRKPKGNVLIVADGKVRAENAISTKGSVKGENKKFFGFRLTTPFESILFLSVSESDRASWVRAIQESIDRAHQSLRGYMLKRTAAMGMERTTRKFWVLHKDTITYHKDHETTKIDEFAYAIQDDTEIEPDDDKWKIKINDSTGKRVVTIQFEDRTHADYPLWRDALLDIRNRHEMEEQQYQEHVEQVMSEAVETGEMEVLGDDGSWHTSTVAFTENEVIIQETDSDGNPHAAFFALSPSSTIKRLDESETGTPFTFQLTTATETIQLTAKSEEQIEEWSAAIEKIIPYPIEADSDAVLLRAALKKLEEDEIYSVTIEEKKALGMIFQPQAEWALIKDYEGYDASVTGVAPGSVLTSVNGQSCIFEDFHTSTTMLKDGFASPDPLVLEFRPAPSKSGNMNKKSAAKKNGKAKWTERFFELQAGKFTIHPIEGEGDQTITIPLKDASVVLVPYSEFLKEYCFRLDVGPVNMVLQCQDLDDMLDWAATLKHAIAICSGGGHILDHLHAEMSIQERFEASVQEFPAEMSEEAMACIVEVGTCFTNSDAAGLEVALSAAYAFPEIVDAGTEFLECATEQLNQMFEDQHGAETDMQALAQIAQPDADQTRLIEEAASMEIMAAAMDCEDADSDDEGHVYKNRRESLHSSNFVPPDSLSVEEEERIAAEESAAEFAHLKALQKQEEPDPEEVGICADEDDLSNVFGFYMKSNDEGGEPYINVMNFCTIWRMITGNRGNLMEEMQIFNSFDADSNGYLEVSDFVTGFLNHSKDMNTNKLLIKLHSLVDGGSVMM